jgi:hypothetical protein
VKQGNGYADFSAADGLTIRFIPLEPKIHFANYKPDFMLEVWTKHCPEAGALFYFDPDITIKCRWTFFEEWVEAGVAVCQDVNGSMPDNHPIRYAWRRLLEPHGVRFRNQFETYFNAGFAGMTARDSAFVELWKHIQELMQRCGEDFRFLGGADRTLPFSWRDQDAFNIACMAAEQKISPVGQDGMEFQPGGYIMSHAIGKAKPWNKPFIRSVLLRAVGPSRADKAFFEHLEYPIHLYPPLRLAWKRFCLSLASLFGRFMRRS